MASELSYLVIAVALVCLAVVAMVHYHNSSNNKKNHQG